MPPPALPALLKGLFLSSSSSSAAAEQAPPPEPHPPSSSAASGGCPFGFTSSSSTATTATTTADDAPPPPPPLFGRKRVILLYEQYIHLPALRDVWVSPLTESPELEPCFSAACHGMEIGYLLLAHFLTDKRSYVQKRSRVELVMEDLVRQCSLLAELVDGELEEDPGKDVATATAAAPTPSLSSVPSSYTSSSSSLFSLTDDDDASSSLTPNSALSPHTTTLLLKRASSSLTQDFPFPCCPPTSCEPTRSPALEVLLEALWNSVPGMTASECVSVTKVVRNITNAVEGAFSAWSVGLGIEAQLNELRAVVGLSRIASFDAREHSGRHLDYARLVRPEVVAATYHAYPHAEDFFFRSVHLGTDCWSFVVTRRLESARSLASQGEWFTASARVRQAAHILEYLGKHVMMLTSMVLRDYLELKVQIEGTSGEGSLLVKAFRPLVKRLFEPLEAALFALPLPSSDGGEEEEEEGLDGLQRALLAVYESPEKHPQLYAYIKSLECVESALLGGFYFHHFRLAVNVIGGEARGTMNRAVQALKTTYEASVFDCLDKSRSLLGRRMDGRFSHLKGKIMSDIVEKGAWRVEG